MIKRIPTYITNTDVNLRTIESEKILRQNNSN
jgi:hypothetical protein